MWTNAALVAAGGFFGAIARYYVSKKAAERFQSVVPYGTLAVNVSGSFLLGVVVGSNWGNTAMLLAGTGFMGAFTTFSTFKLESAALAAKSRYRAMVGYIAATYILSIVFAYIGFCISSTLWG